MCSSVTLEGAVDEVQHRVSTTLYEWCRSGKLELKGFPNFGPTIQALQEGTTSKAGDAPFKVTVAKHDRLVVLQSLAQRWLEFEGTSDEATAIITEHNNRFNAGGEFTEDDTRTALLDGTCKFVSLPSH